MLVNHLAKRHPDIPPDTVPELNLPILKVITNITDCHVLSLLCHFDCRLLVIITVNTVTKFTNRVPKERHI